jgi:hypothetical protein
VDFSFHERTGDVQYTFRFDGSKLGSCTEAKRIETCINAFHALLNLAGVAKEVDTELQGRDYRLSDEAEKHFLAEHLQAAMAQVEGLNE